jgi:hypothetical protein
MIFIALMGALGIALKPVVGPVVKSIAAFFVLPAGVIAGTVYMIWPMLALLVTHRRGTAVLVGLIEAFLVTFIGIYGSHGILSLVTYILPCLCIDIGFIPFQKTGKRTFLLLPPALGNLCGALLVGRIIMHLQWSLLLPGLFFALFFGSIAGPIAYALYRRIQGIFVETVTTEYSR